MNLITCKAKLFQEKLLEHLMNLVDNLLTLFVLFPAEPSPNTAVS